MSRLNRAAGRFELSSKRQLDFGPRQLHRNGLFWAAIASILIAFPFAILALIGPAPGAAHGEHAPCSLESASAILMDTVREHPRYDELRIELGETRAFPPATKCLLYGRNDTGSGTRFTPGPYHLVASRFYPDPASYLWLLLLILSPILLVLVVRLFRRLVSSRS